MGDLSDNFSRKEFACKCGCGYDTVDVELVELLQGASDNFDNRLVTINSGCRCKDYNEYVGGSEGSQHLLGRAADIDVEGILAEQVQEYFEDIAPGLGCYDNFTHVDSRRGTARWLA
jgi:uncharacterized protein YcbK (DUF882 family)